MVSNHPASFFYRGAAAVLFLTLSTLAFTSSHTRHFPSARQRDGVAANRTAVAKPPDAAARKREAEAREFIEQALRTWQERMSLKDWNIDVRLVRAGALEPDTLGNIHWDSNIKKASIEVLSSYDYPLSTPAMLDDMEFTVVHELVHLDLASLPRSKASRRNEEHAVNQLANALLNLARQPQN
jgi:hypothetical protein